MIQLLEKRILNRKVSPIRFSSSFTHMHKRQVIALRCFFYLAYALTHIDTRSDTQVWTRYFIGNHDLERSYGVD
jgi:hypothetical protein